MANTWILFWLVLAVFVVLICCVHLTNKTIGALIETNDMQTEYIARLQERLDKLNARVIDMDREIGKLIAWHEREGKK